eukprot:g16328.t1
MGTSAAYAAFHPFASCSRGNPWPVKRGCGLAQSQASLQWIHEILPPADRPRWLEQTLCAVKRALLMALREEERFGDGAKRLLGDFDERKAGALSLAQLRRALKSLGLSAGQREARRNTTRDETGERRGLPDSFADHLSRGDTHHLSCKEVAAGEFAPNIPADERGVFARPVVGMPPARDLCCIRRTA